MRRGFIFIMPIFLLAWFFVFGAEARAADVNINTTWPKENSPYIIQNSVTVYLGATLTINPGVIIKFASGASLVINGKLYAKGKSNDKIIFTSIKDDNAGGDTNGDGAGSAPSHGDWNQIIITSAADVNISQAEIKYGGGNGSMVNISTRPPCCVPSDQWNKAIIANSLISFSKTYGIYDNGWQTVISKNTITGNKLYGIWIEPNYENEISYNNIHDNGTVIIYNRPSWPPSYSYNGGGISLTRNGSKLSIHYNNFFNNVFGFVNATGVQVNIANNYWGSSLGPIVCSGYCVGVNGRDSIALVEGTVIYEPFLTETFVPEPEPEELEPVIIVPGIMGSDLINASDPNDKIWLDVNRVIGSWSDDFLNYLEMDNNGNMINAIKVGDAIREIKVLGVYNQDVLKGLISYLQTNGYQENNNLFVFPYDWRQNINLIATQLNQKILDVLFQTGAQKVNIIAHSMGGLVTKDYMKESANQNKINKFIDIATPHLGTPQAFKVLKYGDNMGVKVILNENRIKTISQNMPSIYELLPSAVYYDSGHIDYNFIYSDQGFKYDYNDMNAYLRIWNNPILVNQAKEFHNNIDDYGSYVGNTQTYNIIGCGFATLGKIIKLNQEKDHGEYRVDYVSGDGTVPLKSAEGLPANKKYYYDGVEHMSLPSANGVTQLVGSILDGEESQFDLSPYPISTRSDICQISGKLVTYHSPIALNAYDEAGNHVGPSASGDIDNQIPGAQYDIIEDNKFVFLPSGHIYRIEGKATGLGAFNSRVETIDNGIVAQTAYYNQIPITTLDTNVEMVITDNQTDYTMKIDQDGDQTFEAIVEPSSILNEQESVDLIKPETIINILGVQGNDNWHTSPVQISFTASDNEGGSGVLKTEYSLDNGQTWQRYANAINIDKQGANKILFKSTDRAGNIEEEKTSEFKIDSIPPTIEMIAPLASDEYDHAENLEILYNSIDNTSGLNESATKIQIDGQDVSTVGIDLFSYHLGGHQLIINASDLAGNQTATTVPFFIVTSIPGTIDDVKRLYSEQQIFKNNVKDELIGELDSIQQYIERFGNRQDKKLSKYQERLEKCDRQGKRTVDCRESVKKLYKRQVYLLNKTYAKIVADRLADLLKNLEKYYAKKWLTPRAYEMIEEELIYLKNNL